MFVQILVQIQQTAIQSQRALSLSVQQAQAKERERRILQLTIDEISTIKEDVKLYKGVGKMFDLVPPIRFTSHNYTPQVHECPKTCHAKAIEGAREGVDRRHHLAEQKGTT